MGRKDRSSNCLNSTQSINVLCKSIFSLYSQRSFTFDSTDRLSNRMVISCFTSCTYISSIARWIYRHDRHGTSFSVAQLSSLFDWSTIRFTFLCYSSATSCNYTESNSFVFNSKYWMVRFEIALFNATLGLLFNC